VRIGQLVTCNGYRHPALLAKMASTVDVLSHGRLTLGIGAGGFEPEYRAYGYEYPATPERLRRLREALQIILAMWSSEEAMFEGTHYQVRGAINQPKGVQKPHIPVLIGGNGEHVLLKLVAQYGDACNVFGDFATLERKFAVLKQHCEDVGRNYQSIRRTTETLCIIGETNEQAQDLLPDALKARYGPALQTALIGSLKTIRQRLVAYEAAGIQELLLRFPHRATRLDSIRRFAQEFLV
jgi:alkanesulfonate monooxygenase SsuD/methylene tetrahydromethanopterin reductase-like flavin-dependent oxidoreductase (luciferase family)